MLHVQGSAADVVKQALAAWSLASSSLGEAVRLVAQIHDELLFEVDTSRVDVTAVASAVRRIMEGVASSIPSRIWLSLHLKQTNPA